MILNELRVRATLATKKYLSGESMKMSFETLILEWICHEDRIIALGAG